jgi:ABC-type sugar transport system ATPase subunit
VFQSYAVLPHLSVAENILVWTPSAAANLGARDSRNFTDFANTGLAETEYNLR